MRQCKAEEYATNQCLDFYSTTSDTVHVLLLSMLGIKLPIFQL
jgi:hypothetical protein